MISPRLLCLAAVTVAAACTNAAPSSVAVAPPPPPTQTLPGPTGAGARPHVVKASDGLYTGSLDLQTASSQVMCPRASGNEVTMRVQDGHATIDLTQGASFGGDVTKGDQLDLTLQDGPSATISGRLTDAGYVTSNGHGQCIYSARLNRRVS